jgi:hypothetical protein
MSESIDPILDSYNSVKAERNKYEKKEIVFDKKNYLEIKLGANETEKDIIVRMIPIAPGEKTLWEELHMHWVESASKSVVCTKNTKNIPEEVGRECPFCNARQASFNEMTIQKNAGNTVLADKFKKDAFANGASKGFVSRVVDRTDEDFGVKFWKFSEGNLDQMINLYKRYKEKRDINIFDTENGYDLIITVKKETGANGKTKTKITGINVDFDATPLSKDAERAKAWLECPKKWSDVFVVKSYEYLKVLFDGGEPWFDKPSNKWINKADLKSAVSVEEAVDESAFANNAQDVAPDKKKQEDLPF